MKYWIWLTQIPHIGCITAERLLEYFGNPKRIYEAEKDELETMGRMTRRQIESIENNRSLDRAESILESCFKQEISILTKQDIRYPQRAKILKDAPVVLYYQGEMKDLDCMNTVGIVGARRCSQHIKKKCYELTEKYVEENKVIISGLAKGIDACAHTACINADGYTVAILGNGLDICYPSEHRILMDRIKEKGLLLSEYPPGTKPTKYAFPKRNRLISAWSDKVVVIAPGKGSGALITEGYARKYSRKIELYEVK